ncbi:unnamed protein product, partial [Ectocarpus fasciculatus]
SSQVGILFFLFEFFSDQLLAFMVLSVVWLCEVYSVVSVRTSVCIRFFPQVFFLYFTLFHVYFFSFPFGFSYLALVTTVLFLQHSMLFCWNRYEASGGSVPALRAGVVSASRPRQAGMVIGVVPRYDPHGMGMPLMSRPSGGSSGGGGGDVPATGRQRAATASSLEQPREESILPAAAPHAGRVISRRNSSPDPTSSSAPLGSSSSGSARGDGVATAPAAEAPAAASPPVALEPPRAADVQATSPVARRAAAGWPLPSGWVGGRSGVGDGRPNVLARHTRRRTVSAPLLGSFPFSFWGVLQTSTADGQTAAAAAAGAGAATTTGAGHARTAAVDQVQRRHGGNSTGTSGDSDSAEATSSGREDGAGARRETARGAEGDGQGVVPVFSPSGSRGLEEKEETGETQRTEDMPVPACAGPAVPPAAQADAPAPAAVGLDGRKAVVGPAGSALSGRGGPAETTMSLRDPDDVAVAGAAADVAAPAGRQSSPPRASSCPDGAAATVAGGGGVPTYTVGPVAASTAGARSNKVNDVTVARKGNEDGSDGHHRERDGGEAAEGGSWAAAGGGGAGGGAHAGAGRSGAVVSGGGTMSPAWASPGPADGAGQVFGGGGQRLQQQQQQQQQQQWEEERLLQGQESPRREEDSSDALRLGLGGTQRWPDNEPGDSGGRASPPMASTEKR